MLVCDAFEWHCAGRGRYMVCESIVDGEIRVTVLGSGHPWVTRGQSSESVLVEIGNSEHDIFILDLGSGSLRNYASLKLPVNKLDKVFFTHLHADHIADLITLSGSYSKVGRADRPVAVWGPSGTEPRLGTRHFVDSIQEALAWDTEGSRGPINPDSLKMTVTEFDFSQTQVVYEANDVKITSFPVIHALSGAVGYRVDFAGLTFVHSGDTCAGWPLVRACEGGVDLLIHECFPPATALAAATGLSIERATMALNAAHTSPGAAGKVFGLVRPRMAGLIHTFLTPQVIPLIFSELCAVYDGLPTPPSSPLPRTGGPTHASPSTTSRRRPRGPREKGERPVIWAILAFLGVPLWLCVLGILMLYRHNLSLRRRPGNVPVRLKAPGKARWMPGHAVWVHDVLAFRGSPAAWKELLVWVTGAVAREPTAEEAKKLHRLGDDRVVAVLGSASGTTIEIAARAEDRDALLGPHAGQTGQEEQKPKPTGPATTRPHRD